MLHVICNTGMRALPDMLSALGQLGIHIRQTRIPMLQLICNTYQDDSLYRAIDHPSQYKCNHWMYYVCIRAERYYRFSDISRYFEFIDIAIFCY